MATTLTGTEAERLTGALPAQIEYLVRQGIVEPASPASRRGVSRKYSLKNLAEIMAGAELFDAGIGVEHVRDAIQKMADPESWFKLAEPATRDSVAVLVLTRLAGHKQAPVIAQLCPPTEVGQLCNCGYTIMAAIPVGYIVKIISRDFPGETLS